MITKLLFASALFGLAAGAMAQDIPSGTKIEVRTTDTIDASNASDGRVYTGTVARAVTDTNGNVVIPQGSNAELMVRQVGSNEMSVDLDSVSVNGRRYSVQASSSNRTERAGVGKNKRTGEFVGGGALLGTILGAVAGGGKGAAIGALAGGAAGAGTQTLTRGKAVHIPSESVLTFQLQQPLNVNADTGYTRNGRHYHRYNNQ